MATVSMPLDALLLQPVDQPREFWSGRAEGAHVGLGTRLGRAADPVLGAG